MSLDISSQEIKESCPLKKENCRWHFLYHSDYRSYNLPVYRCESCGIQTLIPKPEQDLEEMYSENYYLGKSEYAYKDERRTEKYDAYVWDARLRNIQRFQKTGNFLDVGCAFGGFLTRAKVFGFQPFGIEVSPYSAGFARERGLEVVQGNFLDSVSKFSDDFFQVITLIEVIEHLPDPDQVFDELTRILAPGGLLILQTANFEGKQAREEGKSYHYYLPGHIYYYSESNLKSILELRKFDKFIPYLGVDFPLLAKLQKSRGSFQSWKDYFRWWRIALYHWKSKLFAGSTSSMVLYAFKGDGK